ncbi:unnamed protein product [Sordaria macrospora k-hell]|uniref:alpha-amylase n=1 Tax=Sordaria macrospora (strain ATCC MYA-333 / DSM 997 / K(L3346) / K-hell) TaxID=771870 RepID=F7W9N0_SORMK|nr:uncharacterized protein SMAC_08188 [Sordaria macrospora k-hell]CCC14021.1 unnamed protein product [Sordaria macrospora k-hell]
MGDNFQTPSPLPAQAAEPQQQPTPQNATLLQAFEWYIPPDHGHFLRLSSQIPQLSQHGISSLWIPPSCKATSPQSNGYDIYDLYDLGEFSQKGSTATKWGTKSQLLELAQKGQEYGVGLYWDAVLNHRFGADHREKCKAVEVDANNRNVRISGRWARSPEEVDGEKGNYDYLMGCDLDYSHPEVEEDVLNWGRWLVKEVPIRGIRFDAVKHFSEGFLRKFVKMLDGEFGEGWFLVGEFWKDSLKTDYLDRMDHKFSLFDAPLVYNFGEISTSVSADLRKVFDDTLVQKAPVCAVTLVQNHDTQPLQALAVPITPWFLPLGYALILLREAGYPCVFYGDLYGLCTPTSDNPSPTRPTSGPVTILPKLLLARKLYAYGPQTDYFDYQTCIGWVRHGTWDRKDKCAVVMSNAAEGWKRMFIGAECAGQRWTDVLGWRGEVVTVGEDGWAEFRCGGCSVSVWAWDGAKGREEFGGEFDFDIYGSESEGTN